MKSPAYWAARMIARHRAASLMVGTCPTTLRVEERQLACVQGVRQSVAKA